MYKICIGRNPDDDGIEGSVPVLIQLPHPRTGQASCYIIRPSEPCLLEVQQADGKAHSWFISNYVQADGSFYTFSPMDPLFLLLPILEKHREKTTETAGRFLSLDDLLHDEICTSLAKLADIPTLGHRLHSISDTSTVPSGDVFYRLNDEKVVAWLQAKAKKLLGNFDTYAFLENSVLGLKDLDESQLKGIKRSIKTQQSQPFD
ncbi:Ydr279p protein family-domain-containing protein [Phlyctochytrium arcticum]|nr:Ydr279p protein family-domain-containing protein [Phlyctochytrium arcticum]